MHRVDCGACSAMWIPPEGQRSQEVTRGHARSRDDRIRLKIAGLPGERLPGERLPGERLPGEITWRVYLESDCLENGFEGFDCC